jgi:acyl transferase domain-containing protein/surfactin synthase thioesterase subunit/acyl carrier protein/short-subunit dehydrogenase
MSDLGNLAHHTYDDVQREVTAAICARWELVLGKPPASIDTAFFDAGGDSAAAVELALLVDEAYPGCVEILDLFDHPTISALAKLVIARHDRERAMSEPAQSGAEAGEVPAEEPHAPTAVAPAAVVGLTCCFPGVADEEAFWRLLCEGRSTLAEIPAQRWQRPADLEVAWVGAFFPDIERFDARSFGFARRDAVRTDPQQHLLLEASRELVQASGLVDRLTGSRTGVFIGATQSGFGEQPSADAWLNGRLTSLLANRISYHYDLRGPSEVVDTACSSSLVAVHRALYALSTGECDLAIAGGISLMVTPSRYLMMARNGMLSPSGACRPFDEHADGMVPGEGVALVMLARLDDALAKKWRVRAIIRGSATGSDGHTNGINAPRAEAQVQVLTEAWRRAAVSPSELSYIEAHGTATPLGDPIEARALAAAFESENGHRRQQPCVLGSVKGNLGHVEWAAGIAGLVKVILALEHREIPPTAGFERASPLLNLDASTFSISTAPVRWSGPAPLRAGISSFGAGGTNCHVVVEEASEPKAPTHKRDRLSNQPSAAEPDRPHGDNGVISPPELVPEGLLYTPVWRDGEPLKRQPLAKTVLLAGGSGDLCKTVAQELRAGGFDVVLAPQESIAGRQPDAFFADLPQSFSAVAWLGACEPAQSSATDATAAAERALAVTVELSRLLAALARRGGLRHALAVTRQAQTLPGDGFGGPELAAVAGVLRAAATELQDLRTCWLDVPAGAEPEHIARAVARELLGATEGTVAYRQDKRLEQGWTIFADAGSRPPRLPDGSVYLLTGALGGIGLALAKHLAESTRARLVLLSRTRLPPREEWERWVEQSDPEEATTQRLCYLLDMEGLGGQVLTLQTDVSDRQALVQAVTAARKRFGHVNAVIHAAGVLEDSLLVNLDRERCAAVLAPKVSGAWALREAFKADPPELVALCSTASTVFGNAGQANYLAANACLDALAAAWGSSGQRVVTINWSTLANVGMAARSGHAAKSDRLGLPPLEMGEALAAFDVAIRSDSNRVLVARLSTARRQQLLGDMDAGQPSAQECVAERRPANQPSIDQAPPKRTHEQVAELIADILAAQLHEPPGSLVRDTNFFDLGASSLDLVTLVEQLSERLGWEIAPTACYEHPTISSLAAQLVTQRSEKDLCSAADVIELERTAAGIVAAERMVADEGKRGAVGYEDPEGTDIAIVALACRLPGAANPEELWRLLTQNADAVVEIPPSRWNMEQWYNPDPSLSGHTVSKWAGLLDDIEGFDPLLFRVSPLEAARMDPHQRLALELAWEVFERAGYGTDSAERRQTGVFLGVEPSEYSALGEVTVNSATGGANSSCMAANRVSYFFNLTGPSMVVDTACSSSALAVHLACRALAASECRLAIAGGVKVLIGPHGFVVNSAARMLSPTGRCHTFDDRADGYVRAEGAGVVLLKPLSQALHDGDQVLAVIKATSTSHDGNAKAGLTAPNPDAQCELLLDAWARARIDPRTIGYVETHGTGTALGDPLEIEGLCAALRAHTPDTGFCAVGSIKANIGHAEAAAGIAGLIKVVLALQNGALPSTPHLRQPNHRLDWDVLPVRLLHKQQPWTTQAGTSRRAGVSAFGFGGANVHIVVEEAPPPQPASPQTARPRVYPLSGRTGNALRRSARRLHSWVSEHHELRLEDVAATLAYGRAQLAQRAAVVAADRQQLLEGLDALARGRASAHLYGPVQPEAHTLCAPPSASSDTAPRDAHDESVVTSSQDEAVLGTAASSYVGGGQDIDWQRAGCDGSPRVLLPTYPFEHQRCWISAAPEPAPSSRAASAVATDPDATRSSWLLKKVWRPVEEVQDSTRRTPDGAWLTIGDDDGVFGHLRRISATGAGTLHRCAESLPAFGNEQFGEQGELSLPEATSGAVVFGWLIDEQELPRALHALGNLMDRIAHTGQPDITPRLVLAVRGAAGVFTDDAVHPVAAALVAGARALAHERPEVNIAVVDLGDLPDEQAAGWLAAAMMADQAWDGAIRDGRLWVAQFTPVEGGSASPTLLQGEPLSLHGEGIYVIAGGSGGVGGVIAQMFVQQGAQRILLLSRTCPPRGDERFIARSADIADREALCAALEEARALHGPIRGVVHAAGVMDFLHRSLRSKTPASIADVLAAKVMGTRLLHELTQDDPLDLFLLCTSISGVFGALGAGQVDYAAANAFQDAYASARSGPGRSLAIAWPRWAEVGMGVGRPVPKLMEELSIGLLGSQDAACLLGGLLQRPLDHTAVVLPHRDPVAAASQLLAPLPSRSEQSPAPKHARLASPSAPATDGLLMLEDWLRTTVAAQLGLSAAELDPHTGLDAYGIDSLNVVDILGAIEQRFGAVLAPSIVLEQDSVARLAAYLHEHFGTVERGGGSASEVLSPGTADCSVSTSSSTATAPQTDTPGWRAEADARSHQTDMSGVRQNEPLAIVGIACRMPGGGSPADLWETISAGHSAVSELPPNRWSADETFWDPSGRDPTRSVSKWGGFLPDAGDFDPAFFGLSKESADAIDPLQRLFLEMAWNVLEDGGYASTERRPPLVGVFAGARSELRPQESAATGVQAAIGYAQNFIAARAAQTFDLRGPAIVVDTACSSSLVAVHMAAASLRGGECDMAIAGGVDLLLSAASYVALSAAGALSPDGRCWAFDARANGYVPGEGAGAVLLRPLSQALAAGDRIYALLLGSALNNDGRTMGVTTPSVHAQREVLRCAHARAGISPASLSYVEAHGTGTAIGDPVETQALREVLAEAGSTSGFCGLGSIKTNIGHLHCAAGIASLLKVVLALHHGQLPPTLNCERPNPRLELDGSPLDLTVEGRPWLCTNMPRRAGVSSFGFGGTNCHAVIEQAPLSEGQEEPGPHLLTLSARDESMLRRRVDQLAHSLRRASGWSAGAVCRSLSTGRGAFEHRLAMWCSDAEQLAEQIACLQEDLNAQAQVVRGRVPSDRPVRIAFLYPGQGAQQPGMGRALYETQPVFRTALDCCANACGLPLQQLLFDSDGQTLDRTDATQPAVFAVEYALTELLRSWGVVPDIVVGHSIGEYAAACAAGMLSVQDASRVVGVRGRLMVAECQPGAMLAVSATAQEVESFLPSCPGVEIALVNAERSVVVGGSSQAVDRFREVAEQSRIRAQPLRVSHAFHTELMEPMLAQFAAIAGELQNARSTLRYISGSSGQELARADAHYWVSHVRQPVRFAQAARRLSELQPDLIVEVGPGRVLTTLVRPALVNGPPSRLVPLLASHSDERTSLLRAAAEMWVAGASLDPSAVAPGSRQQSPLLPTYPFARVKCALPIDAPSTASEHRSINGAARWGKRFSTREPAVADHTVAGRFFLPGVTWIDGAAKALGSDRFTLSDLTFLTPLECQPGSDRQATLLAVADTNGKRRFSGTSRGDDPSNELVHVRGELAIEAPDVTTVELAQLRGRMPGQRAYEEVYDVIRACGITHGPYYRSLQRVHVGDGEALAELELTAQARAADTGPLHPALLDAATTAGAALGVTGSGWEPSADPFIPFHIERVEVLRPLPASCLAWYRLRSARAEVIVFDLDLIDEQGRCCVRFHGFTSKRFRHSADGHAHRQAGASDRLLAAIEWSVARPVDRGGEDSPLGVHGPEAHGPLVLLADTLGISDRIETWATQRHIRVVHVQPGERFEALDANRYQIAHDDAGHFLRILQDVKRSCDDMPLTVVHAWSCSAEPISSLAALERRIDLGTNSLLALAGALAQDRGEALLRILTTDAYSVSGEPAPGGLEAACVIGLSRCLPWELPNVDVCSIDVSSDDRQAWEHVPTELASRADEPLVALRKEQRSVARIVPVTRLPTVAERPADTCVLAGGLGGIGMALAKHLADGGLRRFAFIQRGDEQAHPKAAPGLQQLRSRGCSVLVLRADVGEAASLAPALERVRRELGPIRTVVHAGGLLRDGLLRSKSPETFRAVLHPKVRGTWLLDALTASDPVGHFLLCSSISALYGAFGQGDYAAANAFLGAFAEQRSRRRRGLTRAIDWSLWDGVGMGSEREIARRFKQLGRNPLQPAQAMQAFDAALALPIPEVVIETRTDIRPLGRHGAEETPVNQTTPVVSAGAHETSDQTMQRGGAGVEEVIPLQTGLLASTAARQQVPQEAAQAIVASETAQLLDVAAAQVDTSAEFLSLGLDSAQIVELADRLGQILGCPLYPTLLFEHVTVRALARHLAAAHPEALRRATGQTADPPPQAAPQSASVSAPQRSSARAARDIAVIALAGRFPGADSPAALWDIVKDGRCQVADATAELSRRGIASNGHDHARFAAMLDGVEEFDPLPFKIAPREARLLDPQHRLVLETVWELFERAGRGGRAVPRNTGVFVGVMNDDYRWEAARAQLSLGVGSGTSPAILANRISYTFDLNGPSMPVETACSSSLVALHLACESLRRGEAKLAIAGGVNVLLSAHWFDEFAAFGMLSPTGRCHAFGANADGYVRGEGVAAVLLKPLQDAQRDGDTIHAVITGSASNHNGRTNGISAPNPASQSEVILSALRAADITPAGISYVEAHGTGTSLGDPVEIEGLMRAYGSHRDHPTSVAIGSVKENIGHLEAAAGIAGLTKVVLCIRHRTLPPSLAAQRPNPLIPFEKGAFRTPAVPEPWEGPRPLRAGLSSFGFGGANAHVIVQEPPPDTAPPTPARRAEVLLLSARTAPALSKLASELHAELSGREQWSLADVCATLAHGRTHFTHRLTAVVSCKAELLATLDRVRDNQLGDAQRQQPAAHAQPTLLLGDGWHGANGSLGEQQNLLLGQHELLDRALTGWQEAIQRCGASSESTHNAQLATMVGATLECLLAWGAKLSAYVAEGPALIGAAVACEALDRDTAARLLSSADFCDERVGQHPTTALIGPLGPIEGAQPWSWWQAAANVSHDRAEALAAGQHSLGPDTVAALAADSPAERMGDGGLLANWSNTDDPWAGLLKILAALHQADGTIDWDAFERPRSHRRIDLPVPDFERSRHWIFDDINPAHEVDPAKGVHAAHNIDTSHGLPQLRQQSKGAQVCAVTWQVHGGHDTPREQLTGGWLILGPEALSHKVASRLKQAGAQTIARPTQRQLPATKQDLAIMLDDLSRQGQNINGICLLDGCSAKPVEPDAELRRGMSALHAVVGALRMRKEHGAVEVWAFTTAGSNAPGAQRPLVPMRAALGAFGRVIAQEDRDSRLHVIDLAGEDDTAIANEVAEAVADPTLPTICALRKGRAWIPRQLPLADTDGDVQAHDGEVWWITGGLGDLGLHAAQLLAVRGARSVILTSRKTLPPRAAWDEQRARDGALGERFDRLLDIERHGATVSVMPADVADEPAMQSILESILDRYGGLHGVIHAAGIGGRGQRAHRLTADQLAGVFRAKVDGATVLNHLTAEVGLRHFICFSSASALVGGIGFADYAAANASLDLLMAARRDAGRPATTINWAAWARAGLNARSSTGLGRRQAALAPQAAIAALDRILALSPGQYAVTSADEIDNQRGTDTPSELTGPANGSSSLNGVRDGAAIPPGARVASGALVEIVKGTIAQVIASDPSEFDSQTPLEDLGFDSRMALELIDALEERFETELPLEMMANAPTAMALANAISGKAGETPPDDARESPEGTGENGAGREFVLALAPDVVARSFRGGQVPYVLCFPPSGGQALGFRAFARALPEQWQVWGVDPPGHGLAAPPARTRIEDIAQRCTAVLRPRLGSSVVLVGHSLGGLTALEVARSLIAEGLDSLVVLYGTPPPDRLNELAAVADRDDQSLLDWLHWLGGVPDKVMRYPELVARSLPALRADLGACERYRPPTGELISAPTLICVGEEDLLLRGVDLEQWSRYVASPKIVMLPGNHFSIVDSPNAAAAAVAAWVTATHTQEIRS